MDSVVIVSVLSFRCFEIWRRGGLVVVFSRSEGFGFAFVFFISFCRRRRVFRRRVYADVGWGGLAGG